MGESFITRKNKNGSSKLWLYRTGDEMIDVTGGWVESTGVPFEGGTVTKNSDNITIVENSATTNFFKQVYTVNKIDLTNYKYLYVEYDYVASGSGASLRFGVGDTTPVEPQDGYIYVTASSYRKIHVLDISNITGLKYIINSLYRQGTGKMYNCWLEG